MRIVVLSDIHIGSIKDTVYVYNVLTSIFDTELKFHKTDAIIFTGDFFHRLLKTNEEYTSLAVNVVSYLVRLCKNKIKIRFIYGTESHECTSYRIFNHHFNSDSVDMKLIETVTEEELFPNVNVLYIPEEYVNSKEEHYRKYLYSGKHYDFIFLHGVIAEGMPMALFNKTNSMEKKTPVFHAKELSDACDICLAGHFHVNTHMDSNVYYVGSLFRNSFNEEGAKGYYVIEDKKLEFVENKEAYQYKTYTFEDTDPVYGSTENLIEKIKEIKEENKELFNNEREGKIRMLFKLPSNIDESYRETIRNLLFNDKKIAPLIKENENIINDSSNDVVQEYEFVLDSSLNIYEKLHKYIDKIHSVDLSVNEIKKYILDDLKLE